MTEFSRGEFLRRTGGVVATLLLPGSLANASPNPFRFSTASAPLKWDAMQRVGREGVWILTKSERMGRRWVMLAGGYVATERMIVESIEIRDRMTTLVRQDLAVPIKMAMGDEIR